MGWYWKQTDWNKYTLADMSKPSGKILVFNTYKELYQYCVNNGINAQLA